MKTLNVDCENHKSEYYFSKNIFGCLVGLAITCNFAIADTQVCVNKETGRVTYTDNSCAPLAGARIKTIQSNVLPNNSVKNQISNTPAGDANQAVVVNTTKPEKAMESGRYIFNKNEKSPSLKIYHDDLSLPSHIDSKEVDDAIRQSAKAWTEGCNINIEYVGKRSRMDAETNGNTVVSWGRPDEEMKPRSAYAANGGKVLGLAELGGFSVVLSSSIQRSQLTNVVMHEIGHIIGVGHLPEADSMMSAYMNTSAMRSGLSDHDKIQCNRVISARYGLPFEEPRFARAGY